ncbi:RagB/SusD domain-containing protein [Cellulophaga algicola DSM 14237]|uniref:RagB/SusD domain-containing protein n=1 Tax=Cellulophaga algicola (strain DSM 14237 / IC166 / ACAM 630) TaxID=688270 RepID=E6XE27_CELAD|nr:RagB/SusD family nutrient uptake outer membrane protein [Cellulophaga algicola]ADV48093.1 RagB/SusD domain-containing protein [Cellulophaga algicola DSM 14237]
MKNIFKSRNLALALSSIVLFGSCSDDVLDQENNNATSTENFGTSVAQVKAAVNGAFHPITDTFFWGRIVHTGALLRSDEFNIFPFGSNTAMSTLQGNPGDRWALEPFQQLYKSIARCNNIIININEEDIADEEIRNSLIGQAYFLRAFDYWYLLNLYGSVPLITTLPDLDNLLVDQAEPSAVWAQIIADLEMAEGMLPDSWSGDDLGRPTAGAATALKGKSYLYMKEYPLAITALQSLVGKYSLLPGSFYGDNFSSTNENNQESVFELQFLGQTTFIWGTDIPGTGTMGNYHIDYAPPVKSPDKGHVINPWLKDLFNDNNDVIRRNETLTYNYAGATGYGGVDFVTDMGDETPEPEGEPSDAVTIAIDAGVEPIFSRKYTGMELGTREQVDLLGTNVGNNWRIIRYADVLLMLAEALNENNQPDLAGPFVDQVRLRAELSTVSDLSLDQTAMRQAIIDERAMELAGEGHRFFDLVRWGLADDYMGATSLHGANPKSLSGGIFQENKHELVWIPGSEIDANPNLKQNPGY